MDHTRCRSLVNQRRVFSAGVELRLALRRQSGCVLTDCFVRFDVGAGRAC